MGIFDIFKKKKKQDEKPVYVVPNKPLVQVAEAPKAIPVSGIPAQPKTTKITKASEKGIAFIKLKEGFRPKPYLDSVNIPTIGYGTIEYEDGRKVTLKDEFVTEARAAELLTKHVAAKCEPVLANAVKVVLNQNQYDALTSFIYNCGVGAFQKSTMLKLINAGNFSDAANEFPKWSKAGGNVIPGLLVRRKEEQVMFMSDV